MKKTSAIICAFNEEKTIADVIKITHECSLINEVIVVNDGSTDNTSSIIKNLSQVIELNIIEYAENKGKGFAMATGVKSSNNDIILFVDADLTGLNNNHFEQLLDPILKNKSDMVLGQATETLINYSINPFKSFTGERALKKENILPILEDMEDSRFGVETLINLFFQSQGKKVKYVMLKNLIHPTKYIKTSKIKATKEYISEGQEITLTAVKNYDLILTSISNVITKKYKTMKQIINGTTIVLLLILANSSLLFSQENSLKLSGELLTDQRILLNDNNDWAWNENRLDLKLESKISGTSKFYSDIWLRNIGVPQLISSSDLYNKDIINPYNLEIREAYIELYGFLFKDLDIKIGRQRIAWGTADKLNPTDNLNPYDLEDILDFGRHRGSDAINLNYYLSNDYSLQSVYIPIFQPANMPVGIFANALNPEMELPQGMVLKGFTDNLQMPEYNLGESSTVGLKFKGFAAGFDFSLSYIWGRDGMPIATYNTFTPFDTLGGITINTQLDFTRTHIFGADLAGSIGSVGVWAEAATFLPDNDVVMTNNLSAMYPPATPVEMTIIDTTVLEKKAYLKYVVGVDYTFGNGAYLNFQYMHGFINERGKDALNDYFFMRLEKKFFEDKLNIAPIGGGFIVSDWKDVENNYALIYIPEISYQATDNANISLSAAIFDGKGANFFANMSDYNMFLFKMKYCF
ncbi:MAG: glycosyltransferase family 2 protein [Bacteroidales bacterium]|nr:glycosyltransferase family 2 protein [Bacteroidales bacterium]